MENPKLTNLISTYKNAAADNKSRPEIEVELEIRLYDATFEMFENLYNSYSKNAAAGHEPTLTCSVTVMDQQGPYQSNKHEFFYSDGALARELTFHKTKLHKNVHIYNDFMHYSIGIAQETPIKPFASKHDNFVRFKNRASIEFQFDGQPWRLDLSAVKESGLKQLDNAMRPIREKLCARGLTPANFISHLKNNFASIDKYEIEIEYRGDPAAITQSSFQVINQIFSHIDPAFQREMEYQADIHKLASYIYSGEQLAKFTSSKSRFRALSPQVKTLNKNNYRNIYPCDGYYASIKIDGVHHKLAILNDTIYIVNSNNSTRSHPSDLTSGASANPPDIIVDAEYDPKTQKYYLFDILHMASAPDIAQQGYGDRQQHLTAAAALFSIYLPCATKHIERLDKDTLKQQFTNIYLNTKYDYDIDGIIIVEPDAPYRDTSTYKWKPYSHNTIDFLCRRLPDNLTGTIPYLKQPNKTLYLLFTAIEHNQRERLGLGLLDIYDSLFPKTNPLYYPIQFSPSADPLAFIFHHSNPDLDNQIVELNRTEDNSDWQLLRIRTDRRGEQNYYGNAFRTAENIFLNYYDKFNLSDLWTPFSGYFAESSDASSQYFAGNKFKRFVIGIIFKKYLQNSARAIDLAIGRGADMPRYSNCHVRELLGMDIDASAIAELIQRRYDNLNRAKQFVGKDEETLNDCEREHNRILNIEYDKLIKRDNNADSLILHVLVTDLTLPYCDLAAQVSRFGYVAGNATAAICNFAFHYLCDTDAHIKNILAFLSRQLAIDAHFIFTTLNGRKVFKLLSNSAEWEYSPNNIPKYKFTREYSGKSLANAGQLIKTLTPISRELMTEPLCNIEYIIKEATTKFGFALVENNSFAQYKDHFSHNSLSSQLTQEDWQYFDLWEYVVLKKVKDLKTRK